MLARHRQTGSYHKSILPPWRESVAQKMQSTVSTGDVGTLLETARHFAEE